MQGNLQPMIAVGGLRSDGSGSGPATPKGKGRPAKGGGPDAPGTDLGIDPSNANFLHGIVQRDKLMRSVRCALRTFYKLSARRLSFEASTTPNVLFACLPLVKLEESTKTATASESYDPEASVNTGDTIKTTPAAPHPRY